MGIKFNQVTWYSRLCTILFVFGVFPSLIFFIGKRYQETVSVLTYAEASAYNLHSTGAYESQAYVGVGSMKAERDMAGEWISVQDKDYSMRFKNVNTFYNIQKGRVTASGSWLLRNSLGGTEYAGVEHDGLFLQKNMLTDQGDEMVQYYKVKTLTEDTLVLQYVDRDNTLTFTKKK